MLPERGSGVSNRRLYSGGHLTRLIDHRYFKLLVLKRGVKMILQLDVKG